MKESTRQSRSGFWAENLVRDIIYASRMLRRDLAFTLIAVVTLALGIGANGAAFSVMRALLFRSLPVPHPERLVRIGLDFSEQEILLSGPLFDALQERGNAFTDVIAWAEFRTFWEKTDSSQLVNVAVISGNGFSVLGLRPEFGRLLTPRDDTAGGGAGGFAAVVSERFWKSQLGGDVTALNRKLVLNHVPVTVVGVMPQNEVRANGAYSQRHFFGSTWLNVFGRRGESVTYGRTAKQLAAIAPAVLNKAIPPQMQGALLPRLGLQIHPGYNGAVGEAHFHGPTFAERWPVC